MGIFSSQHVGVLPVSLVTKLDLAGIGAALTAERASLAALSGGWSGPVAESRIGYRNEPAPVADPVLIPATDEFPERLHARFYYYISPSYLRNEYPNATDQERSLLQAIDVWVSKVSGTKSTYLALFSTRHVNEAKAGPYEAFDRLIKKVDPEASTTITGGAAAFDEPDVFLWLLKKNRDSPLIHGGLRIGRIEKLSGEDGARRLTALSNGVDFNRPGFLVAVAEADRLGPIRVQLRLLTKQAKVTYDLYSNGSAALYWSGSHYRHIPDEQEARQSAVADLYYHALPDLLEAYEDDDDWDRVGRAAEIKAAADALIARYQN